MIRLNWFGYVIVVFFVLQFVLTISLIGKERKPIEPGTAIITFFINMAFIMGILFVGVE